MTGLEDGSKATTGAAVFPTPERMLRALHRLLRDRSTQLEFLRFATVGGLSSAAYAAVMAILVLGLDWRADNAAIPSYLCAMVPNYLLQRIWTFGSDVAHAPSIARYLLTHLTASLINWLVLNALFHGLGINFWITQVISIGVMAIWSYLLQKIWVF